MIKIGIYCAYWMHNWDADFLPLVAKVANLGFDVIEVNSGTVANMNNLDRDRLKSAAEKAGVELTFCIGLTKNYDIASENKETRDRGIGFLKKQAEMLNYMKAKELGGIIYSCWPGSLPQGETDRRPYIARSVESMKEVMKTVEDLGVIFNIEAVNRFEQYMINTCEEALDYVKRVGSDHCKILLDTFHMNIEEDSIYDAIVKAGDNLGHFHVGETNRRAPGRGRIPWDEIGKALKSVNYQDCVVMEPFLMPGGEIGKDICVHRDLSVGLDLDTEARRALDFIREKLG